MIDTIELFLTPSKQKSLESLCATHGVDISLNETISSLSTLEERTQKLIAIFI
jgi:hypothetical protein